MGSMGKWRQFFEGADGDIWSVIEAGILVAASDCPNELRKRRDMITQKLFTSSSAAAAAELGSSAEEDQSGNAQEEDLSGNGEEKNHSENVEDQKQSVKQHGRPIIRINILNKVIKCFVSTAAAPANAAAPITLSLGSSSEEDHSENAQEEDHSGNGEEKDHSGNVEKKDQSGKVEDPKQSIKHVGTDLQEWKLKSVNEKFLREKMEASKRRLHQGYQQAEKVKRQRTVQVIELPKQHGRPNFRISGGRPTFRIK